MTDRGILRLVGGTFLSIDPVELNPTLLQDNHLLCGHIVCYLQCIEVSSASHLLSGLRLSIPVDGTISLQVGTGFLKPQI